MYTNHSWRQTSGCWELASGLKTIEIEEDQRFKWVSPSNPFRDTASGQIWVTEVLKAETEVLRSKASWDNGRFTTLLSSHENVCGEMPVAFSAFLWPILPISNLETANFSPFLYGKHSKLLIRHSRPFTWSVTWLISSLSPLLQKTLPKATNTNSSFSSHNTSTFQP